MRHFFQYLKTTACSVTAEPGYRHCHFPGRYFTAAQSMSRTYSEYYTLGSNAQGLGTSRLWKDPESLAAVIREFCRPFIGKNPF